MFRPDWDEYFLGIARAVSARADCTRRRVGAVIVGQDRRIVSTGYNGSPPGAVSCMDGHCPRGRSDVRPGGPNYGGGYGDCIALHAERNAVLYAPPERLAGSTVYVTAAPCQGCSELLHSVGIKEVVYR